MDAVKRKGMKSAWLSGMAGLVCLGLVGCVAPRKYDVVVYGGTSAGVAAAVQGKNGDVYTMITMETPDWSIINDLIGKFREEVAEAVESTDGHINLINQSIKRLSPGATVETSPVAAQS